MYYYLLFLFNLYSKPSIENNFLFSAIQNPDFFVSKWFYPVVISSFDKDFSELSFIVMNLLLLLSVSDLGCIWEIKRWKINKSFQMKISNKLLNKMQVNPPSVPFPFYINIVFGTHSSLQNSKIYPSIYLSLSAANLIIFCIMGFEVYGLLIDVMHVQLTEFNWFWLLFYYYRICIHVYMENSPPSLISCGF